MEKQNDLHMNIDKIRIIAFDADDTLWVNEPYFKEAEEMFCQLMQGYLTHQSISQILFTTQVKNLPLYGYGIKGYILSMIESAIHITKGGLSNAMTEHILNIGKELLSKPIVLLDDVEDILKLLKNNYKLVVATKGDLKDQHLKLHDSGLGGYFHHIEVMIDKETEDYDKLLKRLEVRPEEFLMIGNSLRSDILPVLELGGTAIHIPFHTTWLHEQVDGEINHPNFYVMDSLKSLHTVFNMDS